jgi:hypothetical protein
MPAKAGIHDFFSKEKVRVFFFVNKKEAKKNFDSHVVAPNGATTQHRHCERSEAIHLPCRS